MNSKLAALALTLSASAVAGCASLAPNTLRVEVEHISHPLAGWPSGPKDQEDGYSALNATLHWQRNAWYIENGLGYNLRGTNGGGFYGPALTYTGRVGREFAIR